MIAKNSCTFDYIKVKLTRGEKLEKAKDDNYFMGLAIKQAQKAFFCDEVPVGCVVVKNGEVISRAYNQKIKTNSALEHAELVALKKAQKKLDDWHLNDCTLFVTLEPCPMCAGACINARVGRIVFGAYDKKAGCCGTLYNLPIDKRFNHRPQVVGGVREKECANLLSSFFKSKRKEK